MTHRILVYITAVVLLLGGAGSVGATVNEQVSLLTLRHYPGSMVTAVITENVALTAVEAALHSPSAEVVTATKGFVLQIDPHTRVWVVLLGVHSYTAPGDYHLDITTHGFLYRNTHTHPVQIYPRDFDAETIALNSTLSDIRSSPDPSKEQETKRLVELLRTANPNALYYFGSMLKPTASTRVTSGYGDRRTFEYADGNSGRGIHNGIDWAADEGTPIVAAGSGRVVMAQSRIITGNSVIIEHLPGVYTTYYHLHTMEVSVGEIVERGQHIATLGSTGISTGPHLHWELRIALAAVDPAPFFSSPLLDKDAIYALISTQ